MFRFPCLIHHCNPLQQTFTLLGCSPYTPLTRLLIPLLSFQPPPKKKPLLGVSSPTIPYTLSTLKWPYVKHTNKQQIKTRAMINFQNNTNLHPKLDTKKLFSPPPLKRLSNYLLNPGFCLWAFGCMASWYQAFNGWPCPALMGCLVVGLRMVLGVFTLEPFFGFVYINCDMNLGLRSSLWVWTIYFSYAKDVSHLFVFHHSRLRCWAAMCDDSQLWCAKYLG
jgi:hypothetical protein